MIHFPFGSSTAVRTDACPPWQEQSKGIPREETTFAEDGTDVHDMLEERALDDDYLFEHAKPELNDMANEMWAALQQVITKYLITEWEPEVTGQYADDVGGTLDMVGRTADDRCVLLDYKTGMGVQVSPVNNKQILFAAAMLLFGEAEAKDLAEDVNDFVGIILQPDRSGEVEIRAWEFTRVQVEEFWRQHLHNIKLSRKGEGALEPGDHCKFCPANGLCDATTGNLLRMKQLDPEDLEQLTWGLDMVEQVKATIKNIEAMAYRQLEVGATIPGWKLVRGKAGNTTWDDAEAALKKLKRMLRGRKIDGERAAVLCETKKIITPTQAKKVLKQAEVDAKWLDEITHRPEAKGTTLAKEDDKRPAVISAEVFATALAKK